MFQIKGISHYLPGRAIHSSTLEKQFGWKNGSVKENSGVITRHFAADSESCVSLAATALLKALKKANVKKEQLDLLIYAASSYDYPVPHTSPLIKSYLGWDDLHFPCFDVNSTCLSFLNALEISNALFTSGTYNTIAIVDSELVSRVLDPKDKTTYSLFGDAAVATIVQRKKGGKQRSFNSCFANYSEGAQLAMIPAGGTTTWKNLQAAPGEDFYFKMEGRKLLNLTFRHLDEFFNEVENRFSTPLSDYDMIVPHQASLLGLKLLIKRYQLPEKKVWINIDRYGNCISASVPLALSEIKNGKHVGKGDKVLLFGTAAGLSFGAVSLEI